MQADELIYLCSHLNASVFAFVFVLAFVFAFVFVLAFVFAFVFVSAFVFALRDGRQKMFFLQSIMRTVNAAR